MENKPKEEAESSVRRTMWDSFEGGAKRIMGGTWGVDIEDN